MRLECGYCGGRVVLADELEDFEPENVNTYVHADAGDRVTAGVGGDFVSSRHNERGTRVNPVDVVDLDEDDEDDEDDYPVSVRNGVDGHWYVVTYGAAPYQIHARDCVACP